MFQQILWPEKKVCTVDIQWQRARGRSRRYSLEFSVLVPSRQRLCRIRGLVGKKNYSFCLLFDNQPIRKYTVHYRHKNPDGTTVAETHKHKWDELNEDRETYVPTDIDAVDINQALKDFLVEINVESRGSYQSVMFQ